MRSSSIVLLFASLAVALPSSPSALFSRQDTAVCGGGCDWTVSPDPCPGDDCLCFKTGQFGTCRSITPPPEQTCGGGCDPYGDGSECADGCFCLKTGQWGTCRSV